MGKRRPEERKVGERQGRGEKNWGRGGQRKGNKDNRRPEERKGGEQKG